MTLSLHPTSLVVTLEAGPDVGLPCRVWEGQTDTGIAVSVLVASIGVEAPNALPELRETPPPSVRTLAMFGVPSVRTRPV